MTKDKRPPGPSRGTVVVSGGTAFQRSPVGDRLEVAGSNRPSRPAAAPGDYAEYMNGFSRTARQKPEAARGRGQAPRGSRSGKKRGFEAVPPGIQMKDVARKILPNLWVRIGISCLAAVIVGILAYNLYMSMYVTYKTEIVTISPYMETIDVEGVAVREEIPLEGSLTKTSVKAVRSGEKVSKGEAIVNTYRSTEEAAAYERIAEIDRESKELITIVTSSENSGNTAENINKMLDNKMLALNACARGHTAADAAKLKSDISFLLNKRMVIMRQVDGYNARIKQLEEEKEALLAKYTEEPKTVKAEMSGYYADTCDGYEQVFTPAMVKGLTVDRLDEIMNSGVTPPQNVIGKLVGSFTWYLACPVPTADAEDLVVGADYTLYLPYAENESIKAALERLNKTEGQDRCMAIFRCNSLASELCSVRTQPVRIQKCRYEGYAIKKSALHAGVREEVIRNPRAEEDFPRAHLVYINQVTFPSVYAVVAGQIVEKEVSIVYGTDKTVICTATHGSGSFLALKDIVVTEERGLYNGKLVR